MPLFLGSLDHLAKGRVFGLGMLQVVAAATAARRADDKSEEREGQIYVERVHPDVRARRLASELF